MKEAVKLSESDEEVAHIDADNILCNLLINLGYKELISEYRKVRKWFS